MKLTDRTFYSAVTSTALIHVVITGDTSQNPAGSSYKVPLQQILNLVPASSGSTTGSTSYWISFYISSMIYFIAFFLLIFPRTLMETTVVNGTIEITTSPSGFLVISVAPRCTNCFAIPEYPR